jgi:hypothetical protein
VGWGLEVEVIVRRGCGREVMVRRGWGLEVEVIVHRGCGLEVIVSRGCVLEVIVSSGLLTGGGSDSS